MYCINKYIIIIYINIFFVELSDNMKNGKHTFIDLFSGCGGLALGLINSGWKGLFAIEKNESAFKTLRFNLIDNYIEKTSCFSWPEWLELKPHDIVEFVNEYSEKLKSLQGEVHLVAGGPPCQGFSFAGRRNGDDPRNELYKYFLKVVGYVKPMLVLMENVEGINVPFKKNNVTYNEKSFAEIIRENLNEIGYHVQIHVINAAELGVPQFRRRCFILGISKDLFKNEQIPDLLGVINNIRNDFLKKHGLPVDRYVTVSDAISDLKVNGKQTIECTDEDSPSGFKEILYQGPVTSYQKLMHKNMEGRKMNSLRLVNHKQKTVEKFQLLINSCEKGDYLSKKDRDRFGIKKSSIAILSPDKPSMTITTLPDDLIHYDEPRIHTVREHARLQSFPDWFEFKDKFTTGGVRRKEECPRYTQVGNAIPPLMAEAIGQALKNILDELE